MMPTASTIMAVFTTPLLTSLLVRGCGCVGTATSVGSTAEPPTQPKLPQVGTLVPVDPKAMFLCVVELVLAPVIVGTTLNQFLPRVRAGRTD